VLDYWLSYGKDAQGSYADIGNPWSSSPQVRTASVVAATDTGAVRKISPLVFDVDNDGYSESIVFSDTGFRAYDQYMLSAKYSITSGFQGWDGQPAIQGFSSWGLYGNGFQGWELGYSGARVVGIAYNSTNGHDYFVSFLFSGANFSKEFQIDLDTFGFSDAAGNGVSCVLNNCFFVVDQNYLVAVDVSGTRNISSINPNSGVAYKNDYLGTAPAFISFTSGGTRPDAIAFVGYDEGFNKMLFVCDYYMTSCTNSSMSLFDAGISNISRLSVSDMYLSNGFPYANVYAVTESGTPKIAKLWSFAVNEYMVVAPSMSTIRILGYGSDGSVLSSSNPALARCAGGTGVAVATTYMVS
jgi:hypothetical protein